MREGGKDDDKGMVRDIDGVWGLCGKVTLMVCGVWVGERCQDP